MDQAALLELLRDYLNRSQTKNPAYSIRAFAKRLNLGVGTVSEVLAGKRTLAPKSIHLVLDRLGASPAERSRVLRAPRQKLSFEYTQLQADQYFIVSEWHYLAILSLLRTRDFKPTALHVSQRLGISITVAKQALNRLLRVKLIRIENGKILRTNTAFQTTDGTPNLALRKSHYKALERALVALDEHPFESFDVSSMTFAFDPKDLKAAVRKIRDFQDEFADEFSTSKTATEVYQLAVQLISMRNIHTH